MITTTRLIAAFGYAIVLGVFYILEKKTGFPFITDNHSFLTISGIWIVVVIILCIREYREGKNNDDQ